MPIYEYECLSCGVTFEKRQSFNDEPKADCPNGHPKTRRLIGKPVIVFKGSGFYINDSKDKRGSKNGSNKSSESKSDGKAESKTGSSSEKSGSKTSGSETSSSTSKKDSSKETS